MASLNLRDVRVADIEYSDLLRIGGAATLRGYFEGQLVGSRALWGTVEYRVLLGGRSFAYAFVDGARIETPASASVVRFASATKFGYGAGARLETPVGLVGVSIALGVGDSFENAKLHVRIANEF
jgi:outer membrane protein insertion porin family